MLRQVSAGTVNFREEREGRSLQGGKTDTKIKTELPNGKKEIKKVLNCQTTWHILRQENTSMVEAKSRLTCYKVKGKDEAGPYTFLFFSKFSLYFEGKRKTFKLE